ncbi:MAG: hypothetical protein A3J49_15760 [Gallionellales bacterium RIFCSPHIGHO2_02_FULL_57_16]|nr:MAG: hypothetical protein A3J49_15760 [Gallionellales bacterium RIFCSPHIGHO2_02_FULL_57_16]
MHIEERGFVVQKSSFDSVLEFEFVVVTPLASVVLVVVVVVHFPSLQFVALCVVFCVSGGALFPVGSGGVGGAFGGAPGTG